jgi:hypothetical protein
MATSVIFTQQIYSLYGRRIAEMYKNLDKLSVQGLVDFVEFAQQSPSVMRGEMDSGRGVSFSALQACVKYASLKAYELSVDDPEEKANYHQMAEEEYLKFPIRMMWRTPDIDKEYAHLRNLDSFTDGELIGLNQRTIKEIWELLFPHLTAGRSTESHAIKSIQKMARKMLRFRRGTHLEENPDLIVDNIHMMLPPWAQWRHHFNGYSSIQDKNLPIGSLCHHGYRYEPHTEPFTR